MLWRSSEKRIEIKSTVHELYKTIFDTTETPNHARRKTCSKRINRFCLQRLIKKLTQVCSFNIMKNRNTQWSTELAIVNLRLNQLKVDIFF